MQPKLIDFQKWYDAHEEKIIEDYFTFLRFPSISTDPEYKEEMGKTADFLVEHLKEMGLDVELWKSDHPCIFASYTKAGKDRPTILLYNHYDVQPADPLDLWHTGPFSPDVREGRVYARGASDNKGQCFYTLQAVKAYLELAKEARVNIKYMIEGEEEIGSPGTTRLLKEKEEDLQADHLLIIDAEMKAENTPGITLGFRGMAQVEITCQNSDVDLHSGIHGGIALNPIRSLVQAFSEFWDDKGKVAIEGFYDDVRPFEKKELSGMEEDFDLESYQHHFGVKAFANEEGHTLVEANVVRPTVEINGISGGYTGEGFKTVIPAKAHAKISTRLVPDQDPKRIVTLLVDFLKRRLPQGSDITFKLTESGEAWHTSSDTPIAKICSTALEEVFEKKSHPILCGASVPIAPLLKKASGAETIGFGVALPRDVIHSPNENFDLKRLRQGFLSLGRVLSLLGESGR